MCEAVRVDGVTLVVKRFVSEWVENVHYSGM